MTKVLGKKDLKKEIERLKCEKNAIVLAHNYQLREIYDVADFVGDSLGLCIEASKTDADIIVFCGVNFMAESAVILNPDKKVIVPYSDAGCAMADMVDVRELEDFKSKNPEVAIVAYVNSSAEVKAVADICCTSSNAVDVVESLSEKRVLFVPDMNLANYVSTHVPEKEIIPWRGFCPAHHFVTKNMLDEVREEFEGAKIIAHPESNKKVLEAADYVASTSKMINCARQDDSKNFFVLTECGMMDRLRRELPDKNFRGLCNLCFDMKKNTLESVYMALKFEKEEVRIDSTIAQRARKAFDRMFNI